MPPARSAAAFDPLADRLGGTHCIDDDVEPVVTDKPRSQRFAGCLLVIVTSEQHGFDTSVAKADSEERSLAFAVPALTVLAVVARSASDGRFDRHRRSVGGGSSELVADDSPFHRTHLDQVEVGTMGGVRDAEAVTSSPFTKRNRPAGLVLTPGASADRDHHTLVAIDEALGDLPVLRLTLATTRVPNAVKKIITASEEFAANLGVSLDRLAYGGRSFGGRSCSVAVAEGLPAAALVLLSYPLHPPGKPDNLRVDHFPEIKVPTMFVSGRKDPFGTPTEFERHVPAIPGPTFVDWVDGNHSPKNDAPVIEHVREFLGY